MGNRYEMSIGRYVLGMQMQVGECLLAWNMKIEMYQHETVGMVDS